MDPVTGRGAVVGSPLDMGSMSAPFREEAVSGGCEDAEDCAGPQRYDVGPAVPDLGVPQHRGYPRPVTEPDGPLTVRPGLVIPAAAIGEQFTTSGGPGGQHANRSRTRVELRLDLRSCGAFTDHQRALLIERFGPEIRVVVDDERSQLRNRVLARERLAGRLRSALVPQRTRTATRATRASQRRRLDSKRRRSQLKAQRRRPTTGD